MMMSRKWMRHRKLVRSQFLAGVGWTWVAKKSVLEASRRQKVEKKLLFNRRRFRGCTVGLQNGSEVQLLPKRKCVGFRFGVGLHEKHSMSKGRRKLFQLPHSISIQSFLEKNILCSLYYFQRIIFFESSLEFMLYVVFKRFKQIQVHLESIISNQFQVSHRSNHTKWMFHSELVMKLSFFQFEYIGYHVLTMKQTIMCGVASV